MPNEHKFNYGVGEEIFKEYKVKDYLGKGGFGTVYLVENSIGIDFALKVLNEEIKMELRGVQDVMKIRSVRLISILDFGKTYREEDCVLMEYVRDNFGDILSEEALAEPKACRYFKEILKGLQVLEENDIIHRDIKPANLFLIDDIIKIGDFGTVRYTSGDTTKMTRNLAATYHYTAPERFKSKYGFSVDRWAGAVIFFKMLTGKFAFDGQDPTEIFGAIMDPCPDLSFVPEKYRAYLSKCFQKRAENRYESAEQMLEEFEKIELGSLGHNKQASKVSSASNSKTVPPKYDLRKTPKTVSEDEFKEFFGLDDDRRPLRFIENEYEDNQDGTVTDYATGLMWEQSGSKGIKLYKDALVYVERQNQEGFAGYSDWRLPTIDELLSLVEKEELNTDLYIAPVFDSRHRYCWSSDKDTSGLACVVFFDNGKVHRHYSLSLYVRLVRSR